MEIVVEDYDTNYSKYTEDPDDANDHDFVLDFVRTTDQDEWTITHTNAYYQFLGYEFAEQLRTRLAVHYNPEEASGSLTLVEINDLADGLYET